MICQATLFLPIMSLYVSYRLMDGAVQSWAVSKFVFCLKLGKHFCGSARAYRDNKGERVQQLLVMYQESPATALLHEPK